MLRNMFKKTYTTIDTKYKPQAKGGEEPLLLAIRLNTVVALER